MSTTDTSEAYQAGYRQGRFDSIADIPHGIEKGYTVVAVVRCRDCKYKGMFKHMDGSCFPRCENPNAGMGSGVDIKDDDYCSYGEKSS